MTRIPPHSVGMTLLLTALVSFGAMSNNMYLPSMPTMAAALDTTGGQVMLSLSAFLVGFGGGQLLYGSLSDRIGRRPALIGGLLVYSAASAVCLAAPGIEVLIGARLVQGIGAAAGQVLARAIVRDLYTPLRGARVLSIMAAVFSLMPAAAPFAGGFLHPLIGWRGIFAVQTGIGILVLAVVWAGFGESLREPDAAATRPRRLAANYAALITSRTFLAHALAAAGLYAGMFAFHSGSAFVFIDFMGLSTELYGTLFVVAVAGYLVGTVTSARITMRVGMVRLIVAGTALATAAGAAMLGLVASGVVGIAAILGPQFLFLMGFGLAMPNAFAGAIGPFPEKAGAASALLGCLQQGAGAAMVAFLGAVSDGTPLPMAACIFGGAALAFLGYGLLAGRRAAAAETSPPGR